MMMIMTKEIYIQAHYDIANSGISLSSKTNTPKFQFNLEHSETLKEL